MKKIKKGDIVARKSHGKDILFFVEDILESDNNNFAILSGVTIRILADAPLNDLEAATRDMVEHERLKLDNKLLPLKFSHSLIGCGNHTHKVPTLLFSFSSRI